MAVKQAMERRATAAVVPDLVRGEMLAAHRPDLAANRLVQLGRPQKHESYTARTNLNSCPIRMPQG
jgi:hypothetical protein